MDLIKTFIPLIKPLKFIIINYFPKPKLKCWQLDFLWIASSSLHEIMSLEMAYDIKQIVNILFWESKWYLMLLDGNICHELGIERELWSGKEYFLIDSKHKVTGNIKRFQWFLIHTLFDIEWIQQFEKYINIPQYDRFSALMNEFHNRFIYNGNKTFIK
jgi:hypothetical protein